MIEILDTSVLKTHFIRIAESWFSHQFIDVSPSIVLLTTTMTDTEIKNKWLTPLIELLYVYITTDDYYAKTAYIGERLNRPFTVTTSLQEKNNYFSDVIKKDIDAFITNIPALSSIQLARLNQLHQFLLETSSTTQIKLLTIGDCLMTQINSPLTYAMQEQGIGIHIQENYIGAWGKETDNFQLPSGDVEKLTAPINIIAISFFTYWGLPTYRNLMKLLWEKNISDTEAEQLLENIVLYIRQHLLDLEKNTTSIIFLHNASGLPWLKDEYLNYFPWFAKGNGDHNAIQDYIGRINTAIDSIVKENDFLFLIDERDIIAVEGMKECAQELISSKNTDILFHYNRFSYYLAEKYISHLSDIFSVHNKKLLFVDFDNTLWDGVMADGPVKHHREKQQLISSLAQHGIILVALSKNDINNIRWSEMSLLRNDFSLLKINWQNKVTNILEAANELNISTEHCLFIDDSAEEIGLIQYHLPQVKCLQATRNDSWSALRTMVKLNANSTNEALKRKHYYHDQQKRNEFLGNREKTDNTDLHRLLEPLRIVANVRQANTEDIDRILELVSRTNQFNCSGNRYPKHELEKLLQDTYAAVYVFDISDRFGDMGTVGVVILRIDVKKSICVLDNFVMSCRAMGYGVEQYALSNIIKQIEANTFIGIVNATAKNEPARGFYPSFGFRLDGDTQQWTFQKSYQLLPDSSWINASAQSNEKLCKA